MNNYYKNAQCLGQLINGVIPGNPVTREYEIKDKMGTAGPSLLWVIYAATKKSSGQPASVWVLNKLVLEKYDRQVGFFIFLFVCRRSRVFLRTNICPFLNL